MASVKKQVPKYPVTILLADGQSISAFVSLTFTDDFKHLSKKTFEVEPLVLKEQIKSQTIKAKPVNVYLIHAEETKDYKIGCSIDVHDRISNLQTGNARDLKTIDFCPGGRRLEKELHKKYASKRIRPKGEWFLLEDKDVDDIVNIFEAHKEKEKPIEKKTLKDDDCPFIENITKEEKVIINTIFSEMMTDEFFKGKKAHEAIPNFLHNNDIVEDFKYLKVKEVYELNPELLGDDDLVEEFKFIRDEILELHRKEFKIFLKEMALAKFLLSSLVWKTLLESYVKAKTFSDKTTVFAQILRVKRHIVCFSNYYNRLYGKYDWEHTILVRKIKRYEKEEKEIIELAKSLKEDSDQEQT
jgi:hypothetical protein